MDVYQEDRVYLDTGQGHLPVMTSESPQMNWNNIERGNEQAVSPDFMMRESFKSLDRISET